MKKVAVQLARAVVLLCALWFPTAATASIDVLDYVNVDNGVDQSVIQIHLNIPVRYKSHVPDKSGDVVRIFVEPLPLPGSDANVLLGRESIQWSPDSRVPLFDVIYEGEGFANTTITLRFQKNVEFEVRPAPGSEEPGGQCQSPGCSWQPGFYRSVAGQHPGCSRVRCPRCCGSAGAGACLNG